MIKILLLFILMNQLVSMVYEDKNNLRRLLTTFTMSFTTPIAYSSTQFSYGQVTILSDGKTMVGLNAQSAGTVYQVITADSTISNFPQSGDVISSTITSHNNLSSINSVFVKANLFLVFQNTALNNDKNTIVLFKKTSSLSQQSIITNFFSALPLGYSAVVCSSVYINNSQAAVMHFSFSE
jgi:hypothetical protein